MIKIGRFCANFDIKQIRGPTNQIKTILRGLNNTKFSQEVITIQNGKQGDFLAPRKIKISICPTHFQLMSFRFSLNLIRNDFQEFDIIHAHEMRNFETEFALRLAKRNNIPFIFSPHGTINGFRRFTPFLQIPYLIYDKLSQKKVLMEADKIVVNSAQEYQEVIKIGVPKRNIEIINVGLPKQFFKNELKEFQQEDIIKILYVGRLLPGRNLETIILALKKLLQQRVDKFVFNIVYDGNKSSKYIEKLKKTIPLKWKSHFNWLESKFGQDLITLYHNSDIFVYSSLYENYGQPIAEAAASKLAIISSTVGIAIEIANLGNGALLLKDPYNYKELALYIKRIIQYPDLRKKLATNAFNYAKRSFSLQKILRQYESLYNNFY